MKHDWKRGQTKLLRPGPQGCFAAGRVHPRGQAFIQPPSVDEAGPVEGRAATGKWLCS